MHRKKPNSWRPTTATVPEPPTTCVAHGRPPSSSRLAPVAGEPCGLDTSHFRAGEPSNPNILSHPRAAHVQADVSSLIKEDDNMSPVSLHGLDAVSMTLSDTCERPLCSTNTPPPAPPETGTHGLSQKSFAASLNIADVLTPTSFPLPQTSGFLA